jgi:hypothetical protein
MVPAAESLDKNLTTSPNVKTFSVPAQTHPVLSTVVFSGLVIASQILFDRSATSLTHFSHTSQIGVAPFPSTFYVSQDPPKLGWAHTFSTSSTENFHQAQALKLDIPAKHDSASTHEFFDVTCSAIMSNVIASIGAAQPDQLGVAIEHNTNRRTAYQLIRKVAYYIFTRITCALAKNNTLKASKVPFAGVYHYDIISAADAVYK